MPITLPATLPWAFGIVPIDHRNEGDGLLAAQYKDPGPRMRALVRSFLTSHDFADTVLYNVENFVLNIEAAQGAQLDLLGRIVGEPRGDQGDDDYRLALAVRILINISNGTVNEIVLIAQTYEDVDAAADEYVHFYPTPPAAFEIEIVADIIHPGDEVHKRMRQAAAAGVGVWTITTPEGSTFTLTARQGDEAGGTDDLQGWGWSGDATLGGAAAWAQGN